jgi:hypothetical protein
MESHMTKLAKLESYLRAGNKLTAKQITSMFKLKNPTAAIHALRNSGVCIYANKAKLYNGTTTIKYEVGQPSRAMIATLARIGAFSV